MNGFVTLILGLVAGVVGIVALSGIQEPYIIKCEPAPQLMELEVVGELIPGVSVPSITPKPSTKHTH